MHVAFVMEQHLGHHSFYENLRRYVETQPGVRAYWIPVTYAEPSRLWNVAPGPLRGSLMGSAQVRRGLKSSNAEIYFFNTQVPAVIAGKVIRQRPYVLCTDITPVQIDRWAEEYEHDVDANPLLRAYKHRANLSVLHGAAHVVAWSTWTRDSLVQDYLVPSSKTSVIPPGVDLELFRPGPGSDGPARILFVGGDFYRKGGPLLLDAFRRLPPGSAELVLVTRSPVESADGVTVRANLLPNSPELIELYRAADLFVLPSRAEAFGIAAVEAAASGLPVIATSSGGLADVVAEGVTGYLVPPDDGGLLYERLAELVSNPERRQQMAQSARARAEQHFSAGTNARRILDTLRRALA